MSNDPNQDQRVSQTYRSLANEQAPPELDRKILAMAANAGKRPLYSRWMSWTRPVAWAATITLCLAITLELSRDQSVIIPAEVAYDVAIPTAVRAPQAEEKLEQDQVLAESVKDEAVSDDSMNIAESMNNEIIAEKTALARSSSKQAASRRVASSMATQWRVSA